MKPFPDDRSAGAGQNYSAGSLHRAAAVMTVALCGLVFATRADAQFSGAYSLVDPSHPTGVYNGSHINDQFNDWVGHNAIANTGLLDTSLAPGSVTLSETGGSGYYVDITGVIGGQQTVVFNWSATSAGGGQFGYFTPDLGDVPLTGSGGTATFTTSSLGYFGFYVSGNSLELSSLTVSGFSTGAAVAVPEPETTALLAGLAGAGTIGLVRLGRRKRDQRA
jgi:hypothetical protein